jgi:hypothetical protein
MNLVNEKKMKWLYKCYLSAIVLMISGFVLMFSARTETVLRSPDAICRGNEVVVMFSQNDVYRIDNVMITRIDSDMRKIKNYRSYMGFINNSVQIYADEFF